MATVVVQQQHALRHSTPPPSSISPALMVNRRSSPIPNKHLPFCPTGPSPAELQLESPVQPGQDQVSSILYPPYSFDTVSHPPGARIFGIDARTLGEALDHQATQPLPDPSHMFPWLHGLHPDNHLQLGFFASRKRTQRKPPKAWRGITVVKLGGNLSKSRIRGAVAPHEVVSPLSRFLMADPPDGFSVRNFQIQTAKLATLSDIVVYGEDGADQLELISLAEEFALAQAAWRLKHDPMQERKPYNTFVLTESFSEFEQTCPDWVATDANSRSTGNCMDLVQWERLEMSTMSSASEISANIFLGPTPEYLMHPGCEAPEKEPYDLMIEASDLASIPGPRSLATVDKKLESGPQRMEFPSSGSIVLPSDSTREVEDFVNTVRWIYYLAHPEPIEEMDHEGDVKARSPTDPFRVLIHCGDGYTESTLLAVAYFMFAEGVPVHEALLKLHCDKKRNFFAYPTDVAFLSHIQTRLLQESPANKSIQPTDLTDPDWFLKIDGSLPSRILKYMYLGNISHANNPELLRALGINRVLSIGEPLSWTIMERERWGENNLMYIDNVQDNGIDPLCQEYARCLNFIGKCQPLYSLSDFWLTFSL